MLVARGAFLIDADELARAATNDPAVLSRVSAELGGEFVKDGQLERQAVGRAVFADPALLEKLNAIVHPWVAARREELEAEAMQRVEPPPLIVHDVPLLFEVGLDRSVDVTLVVTAPLPIRVRRVAARSGLSDSEVRSRDAAQLPEREKAARADFVIDNAGSEEELEGRVARLWPELLARRATRLQESH